MFVHGEVAQRALSSFEYARQSPWRAATGHSTQGKSAFVLLSGLGEQPQATQHKSEGSQHFKTRRRSTHQALPGSVSHCSKMFFMKVALATLGPSVHTLSNKSHNACQRTHVDMHTCGEIMYSSDAVTIGLLITHEMKTRPMIRYVAVQCFLLPCNQACSSRASARSQCARHSPLRSVAFQ